MSLCTTRAGSLGCCNLQGRTGDQGCCGSTSWGPQILTTGWPTGPLPSFPEAQGLQAGLPQGLSSVDDAPHRAHNTKHSGLTLGPDMARQAWLCQTQSNVATLAAGGGGSH